MTHTPGPWRVTHTDYSTQWIEADCGMGVARIAIVDDGAGCQPGNDALIAAAPELLEALVRLENTAGLPALPDDPSRVAARKAIAKARGEE